jgi:hypothetical protein
LAPKEFKICKQADAGTTRHITLTIPDTLKIIRKPGSATSQSDFIQPYKIGLKTFYITKKHK